MIGSLKRLLYAGLGGAEIAAPSGASDLRYFTAIIVPAVGAHVVRSLELATVGAFRGRSGLEGVMGAAHIAARL